MLASKAERQRRIENHVKIHGDLNPKVYISEARNPEHPDHSFFWGKADEVIALRYRETTLFNRYCRDLVVHIQIREKAGAPTESIIVRLVASDPNLRGVTTSHIVTTIDPQEALRVQWENAKRDWDSWLIKYGSLLSDSPKAHANRLSSALLKADPPQVASE